MIIMTVLTNRQPWPLTTSHPWLSARLQYLQCVSTGDTAVLHWAINMMCFISSWALWLVIMIMMTLLVMMMTMPIMDMMMAIAITMVIIHDDSMRWKCFQISLKFVPEGLIDNKSALVQVMVGTKQATSHYLSQCWHSSSLTHICSTRGEMSLSVNNVKELMHKLQ